MNLERSIGNFEKKLNRVDPVVGTRNKTGLSCWKGRKIIPLEEWIEIRDTPYALNYFPDDFDQIYTYISEDQLKQGLQQEDEKKWDSDFLELMEYTKNPNYGRLNCFHCLLSPDGDDPIFIGINRLVAKGLNNDEQKNGPIEYPCRVVNRFQCPYERTNMKNNGNSDATNPPFATEELFRLQRMAFIVEIALAKSRKEDSKIQIRDKNDLLHALTDRDVFTQILQQAEGISLGSENLKEISAAIGNKYIVDYFMRIKEDINLNGLRFY